MRSLFLLFLLVIVVVRIFGAPSAGIMAWTWLSLMTPHRLAWGFMSSLPVNEVVAAVTLLSWIFSKERKQLPMNALTWLLLIFVAIITITTLSPLNPDLAWDRWSKVVKVISLGLLIAAIITDKKRLHTLAWIIVLSLGYFSVRGGLLTILTLGRSHIIGPPNSSIFDNNYLALAMTMTLPLMYYLFLHSSHRVTRLGLAVAMGLSVVGVFGTYSRGGFIGLTIMGLFLWWRSGNRIVLAILAAILIVPIISYMPTSWVSRMQSVSDPGTQVTFLTRLDSWKVAYRLAGDHPLLGGGFGATENPSVYQYYSRGESPFAGKQDLPQIEYAKRFLHLSKEQIADEFPPSYTGGHAVHSIYLQVLADHGYPGLVVFLLLLGTLWLRLGKVRRMTRTSKDQKWAHDLATMLQISMLTYFTAGAAVSMCYYDLPYLFIGLTLALEKYLKTTQPPAETAPGDGFIPAPFGMMA